MLPIRTHVRIGLMVACALARGSGAFPGDAFSDPEFNLINPYFPDTAERASTGDRSWQDELESRVRLVDEAMAQRDYAAARRHLRHAMSMAPDHDALILRAGQIALMQGRYFVAEDHFSTLAQRYPDDLFLRTLWGGSLIRAGRAGEATAVLRQVHERDPLAMLVRFNLAIAEYATTATAGAYERMGYLNAREVGQASSWIADEMEFLSRLMTDEGVKGLCGYVFLGGYQAQADHSRQADWREAAGLTDVVYDEVGERCRTVAEIVWRAHEEGGRGEFVKSIESMRELDEPLQSAVPIARMVAFLLWESGDKDGADHVMMELLEAHASHPRVMMDHGYYLLESDRADEARERFRGALELWPDDPYGLFGLACATAATGDRDEARRLIGRLKELAPRRLERWESMYLSIYEPVISDP